MSDQAARDWPVTFGAGFPVRVAGLRRSAGVLAAALAIAITATLGYLYHRTQGAEYTRQNEVLGLLRELGAIDARWDADLLRERVEIDFPAASAVDYSAQASRIRKELTAAARDIDSAVLTHGAAELAAAFVEKAELVDKCRKASAATRHALRDVLSADTEIAGLVRGSWAEFRDRERLVAAESAVTQLLAEAQRYYFGSGEGARKNIEATLADLRGAAAQLPPGLRDGLARLDGQVQQLLGAKPIEDALFHKLSLIAAGPRANALTGAYLRELDAAHAERERYRAYLKACAGALLVLIGYLAARLVARYRRVRLANDDMARLVAERNRELAEARDRLKESEAELIQTGKMSALGQMVAGVAHEINAPLADVKESLGSVRDKLPDLAQAIAEADKLASLLKAGTADPDALAQQFTRVQTRISQLASHRVTGELQRLLSESFHRIEQLSEIVGNMMNFARLERSELSTFDLNEGLDSTLVLARHELKRHTVQKQYGDIPPVTCYPSQINQVLLNLVSNAAQAIESERGTIKLTTRRENDSHVAVEIEDNGKGIPPDVLPRIFDPFFTTRDSGKGTGLGLPASLKIVEQHGGKITVDSAVGIGTKFRVVLPLTPPAPTELAA